MAVSGSLFTGGALADIGIMQAGYEPGWGVELEAGIAAVANANIPYSDRCYAASVIGFNWAKLDRVDHLHLSPPCTRASVLNNNGGETDLDLLLGNACIEALTVLQPSTVTLENVEGYKRFKSFQKIVNALYGLGYWVDWQILNSADFGVPQTRRRLILRAVRDGSMLPLPAPCQWQGWYTAIIDLLPTLPQAALSDWQEGQLEGRAIKQPLMIHANDRRSFPTRWGHEPAFTQLAGGDSKRAPGISHKFVFPGVGVYRETVRSKARIQAVPDWYSLDGVLVGLAQKILGNGVPPLMMQKIMETMPRDFALADSAQTLAA